MSATPYPPVLVSLLRCAAIKLRFGGQTRGELPFVFGAGAGRDTYVAAVEWMSADEAPRVLVFKGPLRQLVCGSMPGRPEDIDPRQCLAIEARAAMLEAQAECMGMPVAEDAIAALGALPGAAPVLRTLAGHLESVAFRDMSAGEVAYIVRAWSEQLGAGGTG